MIDAPLDLDAYRRRIGFDGPDAPTLETLAGLIEQNGSLLAALRQWGFADEFWVRIDDVDLDAVMAVVEGRGAAA